MLGSDSDPYQPRRNRLQRGEAGEQPQREGDSQLSRRSEHARDDSVLDQHLNPLGHAGGELAPGLHLPQISFRQAPSSERFGEDVRRRHRILDGEVDPHAADRRHGVGGVADAEQARPVPAAQPVHPDGQRADRLPAFDRIDMVPAERDQGGDRPPEFFDPVLPQYVERSFRDHVAALPVVATVDHDEDAAVIEAAERLIRIGGATAAAGTTARPSERRAPRLAARQPRATVECRPSAPITRSARMASSPSGVVAATPTIRPPSSSKLFTSASISRWKCGRRLACSAMKSRKSHCGMKAMKGHLSRSRPKSAIGDPESPIQPVSVRASWCGKSEQVLQQPELVHHLQGRGVDGVAPEVAQEIGVLLKHQHIDAGPGKQIARHHPGRSPARDAAGGFTRELGLHGARLLGAELPIPGALGQPDVESEGGLDGPVPGARL